MRKDFAEVVNYEFEIEQCQPGQVVGEVEKLKADLQEAMVGLLYIVKSI